MKISNYFNKTDICTCECHKIGAMIMHDVACCDLVGLIYLTQDTSDMPKDRHQAAIWEQTAERKIDEKLFNKAILDVIKRGFSVLDLKVYRDE